MRPGARLVVIGLALLAILASACGKQSEGEPFVIGYVAPFENELSGSYDRVALAGAQYEAARLNSRGGLDGRRIEIVAADVGSDSKAAGAAARDLIAGGADVLFAAPFPELASLVVEAGAEAGIPVLSVAGTIPSIISSGDGMAFLNAFGDNVQAAAAAEVAFRAGHRTVVLVSTADIEDYGDTLPFYFADAFTVLGGSVVATVEVNLDDMRDFGRVVDTIAGLPEPPDLVYTAIYPPWLNGLLEALRSSGYSGSVYGADGAETAELLAAGPAAEGMVLTSHAFTSSHATVGLLFSPRSPAERISQFVDGFERFHSRRPESLSFAALGADAVGVIHAAARRASSDDPRALAAAIADLDRVQVTTGRVTYRGNGGVPVKVVYVLEVRNGEFGLLDVVEPKDVPEPLR